MINAKIAKKDNLTSMSNHNYGLKFYFIYIIMYIKDIISNIKNSKKTYEKIDNIILIILFLILFFILNNFKKLNLIITFFYIIFVILLFKLELRFALRVESGEDSIVSINKEKFKNDSNREMSRYIEDTIYYNNLWRISMIISVIISLFSLPFLSENITKYSPYITIFLFSIIYHSLHWKIHHSYNFILKTIMHCLNTLKNKEKYNVLKHLK